MGNKTTSKYLESTNDKTFAIKYHPFSPLFGHIAFSFETSISKYMSFEFGGSYIYNYRWNQTYTNTKGFSMRMGYKFITAYTSYKAKQKHPHLLQGSYIKPELLYTFYSTQSPTDIDNNSNTHVSNFSINAVFGKQLIINNTFLFDWYVGFGPAFQSSNSHMYYYNQIVRPIYFLHYLFNTEAYLGLTVGIKIGILVR